MDTRQMQSFFVYHFLELRWKCFYSALSYLFCGAFSYVYADQFILVAASPLQSLHANFQKDFITTEMTEAFYASISVAFYTGFVFCVPVFVYFFVTFIRSSLYQKENVRILAAVFTSSFLFIVSHFIVFWGLLPFFCSFFVYFDTEYAYQQGKHVVSFIELEPRLYSYISFILKVLWGSHFLFQTPLLSYFVLFSQWKNVIFVLEHRRYVYFVLLLMAALISPPDIFMQFLCFLFFVLSFEMTVFFFILLHSWNKSG